MSQYTRSKANADKVPEPLQLQKLLGRPRSNSSPNNSRVIEVVHDEKKQNVSKCASSDDFNITTDLRNKLAERDFQIVSMNEELDAIKLKMKELSQQLKMKDQLINDLNKTTNSDAHNLLLLYSL